MRFLTPCLYESTPTVRGKLLADFVWDFEKGYRGFHEFVDTNDKTFAVMEDDRFTLRAGFESDLCSPAFFLRGRWIGTHTGPKEAPGAFVHDSTRRVYRLACVPFGWKDTNDFFWDALKLSKSRVTRPYHFAVSSPIGKVFSWMTEKKLDCYCNEK